MHIETDYLVIGAGASGLAFTDALVDEAPEAEVTMVDRRSEPGGHWRDAYPFIRLHSPSAYYGVNSMRLGQDRVDESGENAGFYERASGVEVCEYFDAVARRLAGTGRVSLLTGHEHLAGNGDRHALRNLDSGETVEVSFRRRLVDARYQEPSVPSTHRRPFEVAPDVRVVPVNDLPDTVGSNSDFAVLGSGKTAVDACTWLVDAGVEPHRIRWFRPREAWFHVRAQFQPLDQVGGIIEGLSIDAEEGARADDVEDLFARLESAGRMVRIDPSKWATMYRGTMLSPHELDRTRQIEDVVSLGRVRRIEADRVLLEHGERVTPRRILHVDCTAHGLNPAPPVPAFGPGRIVLQQVRHNSPTFNSALTGFVEASRDDDTEKNRLCRPNPYASSVHDWPHMMSRTWRSERRWLGEPDLSDWLARSRLNLIGALPEHAAEPAVSRSLERFLTNVGPAISHLEELDRTP